MKKDTTITVGDFEKIKTFTREIFPKYKDKSDEEIKINAFTEGITNVLYQIIPSEEFSFLIRINGEGTEKIINRTTEEKVLSECATFGQAPKVYCRFLNGSAYEYFEGNSLKPDELPSMMKPIAETMKKFHSMKIHTVSQDEILFTPLGKWIQEVKSSQDKEDLEILEKVEKEIEWVQNVTKDFMIGFCHNDLLAPNIIYNEKTKEMRFIDFEYAFYNYIAFDIANHFCEFQGYEFDFSKYPSKEVQLEFIKYYIGSDDENRLKLLYKEVRVCSLLSNLFWGVWALFQNHNSKIEFDFKEYAKKVITEFTKN